MMKLRKTICSLALLTTAFLPAVLVAGNLIRYGTFDLDKAEIMRELRKGGRGPGLEGTFDLFTEDATWNKCIRLTAGPARKDKASGSSSTGAGVIFSGDGGKGIPVEPDQFYDFSFDLKGSPKRVLLDIVECHTVKGKKVSRVIERGLRFVPKNEWSGFKWRFRTGRTAKRIEFHFALWTYLDKPDSFSNGLFKPGDDLFIDNLSLVRDDRFPKIKAMLEKAKEPFRVAPYPVESDASCPFLPAELLNPPEKIVLRAAVNEKKPLPVAIANLTDAFAQYRVTLEANPEKITAKNISFDTGKFGLAGYPREKIAVREALRFKDTESAPVTLRLDPLVDVNAASVISVPPKEAGAVWFDFDTYGVKPGVYRGRLHVIPLAEGVRYRARGTGYSNMKPVEKVIPVEFTVDPIVLPREPMRPAHMSSPCTTEDGFRIESDIGARIYNLRTRLFTADAAGNPQSKARKVIAEHLEWAKRRGTDITFIVKFEAFSISQLYFNPKKDPALKWDAWEKYVHTVAKVMEEGGVPFENYYIMLKDEPANVDLPELHEALRRLKRLYPRMRTYLSVCHRIAGKIDVFDYLGGMIDLWTMNDGMFVTPGTLEKFHAVRAKHGSKLLHYLCSISMRESLSGYYRRHCWRGEHMDLDADGMYRFRRAPNPLYGELNYKVITYAELVFSADGREMPTVRYMAYREGVTDIKYLHALREKRGKEPEIAAFLKKAAERVVKDDPQSDSLPGEVREEIRRLLLEDVHGKK